MQINALAQPPVKNAVVKSMLIFPTQSLHVHSSCLVILPNEDLLVCWFQGSGERTANDVKIMGARLKKNATAWSTSFVMADTYNLPDCNPVIFLNNQNRLFLIWVAVIANQWENSVLKMLSSSNYLSPGAPIWEAGDNILLNPGESFEKELLQKFKELPKSNTGWSAYAPQYDNMILEAAKDPLKRSIGWMPRISPLILNSGRIILPLYSDGYNLSMMAISDDNGKNWQSSLPMAGRGNVQPSLVQKKDGTIVAYMRDNGDDPNRVQISESKDNGENWTVARKTEIPNTASVKVTTLKDGKWAMVVNDQNDGRYRLSLYLSDDEGAHWKWKYPLEETEKDQGSFSYPSMTQSKDGLLHISYSYQTKKEKGESIKYVVVDINKIIL